jgi:tetratricopeptide (TPR) repeat protein
MPGRRGWIVSALLVLASWPSAARTYAIVIGISDYPGSPLTLPLPWASDDARVFASQLAKVFDGPPLLLNTPNARLNTVKYELNRVFTQTKPGDTVCLFISSRGVARAGGDGYIGTADMVWMKPESTGLPVNYIRDLITDNKQRVSRVIVFADISRKPRERAANQINEAVLDQFGNIKQPVVAGILATQPGEVSEESDSLKQGVFGYYLTLSGSKGYASIPTLYDELTKLLSAANTKQRPLVFGDQRAGPDPIWHQASADGPIGFSRYPMLFASSFWLAGLLAMQQPDSAVQKRVLEIESDIREGLPRNGAAFADQVLGIENRVSPETWERLRGSALAALADRGQRVVNSYGTEDLLPEDPSRVGEQQFSAAASDFEAALKLTPAGGDFRRFREGLIVRKLFCEGRPRRPGAVDLLMKADGFGDARIPETQNALGIAYLENAPRDIDKAIRAFQDAKAQSPAWMYPRTNLALAYIENGDYSAAEREYLEAIAKRLSTPQLYYNYGLLLHRLNRRREAEAAYKKAEAAYDQVTGELEKRAKDWEERKGEDKKMLAAEGSLARSRAAIYRKNKSEVYNAWGALLVSEHDNRRAREMYTKALSANPDHCPARENLSRLEDSAAAIALLDHASCAQVASAQLRLGQLQLERGNYDAARTKFDEARRLRPDNTQALAGLAAVASARGGPKQAAALLQEAVRTQQKEGGVSPSLFAQLGEAYRAMGDAEQCRTAYQSAIEAIQSVQSRYSRKQLRSRMSACTTR